jgi:hypothetical protein
MRKILSLCNLVRKPGAGVLIPVYFVLGIVVVPVLVPEVDTIQKVLFQECHKGCHVENGQRICTGQCSWKDSSGTRRKAKSRQGSTGATHPPPPPKSGGSHHQ